MEIGTEPRRWKKAFHPSEGRSQDDVDTNRLERWQKTNIARLDYLKNGRVAEKRVKKHGELKEMLDVKNEDLSEVQLRLWVVEDLSRAVIELLGSRYDVEPAFFREHIIDVAWHNVRDYWRDPPNLDIVARKQDWLRIRFMRGRYFPTTELFKAAVKESEGWNIFRRPDDDENNKSHWDHKKGKVGLVRSRASFWMKKPNKPGEAPVGILLLDPTVKAGHPLWQGHRNWEATPGLSVQPRPALPFSPEDIPRTFFEDFIYWAKKPEVFAALAGVTKNSPGNHANSHVPVQALLHLVCAEWFNISDYIKTRLTQIDWEIAYPKYFLTHGKEKANIDISLKKLHVWRRFVPIIREMLSETLSQVFRFPCHTPMISNASMGERQDPAPEDNDGQDDRGNADGATNGVANGSAHGPASANRGGNATGSSSGSSTAGSPSSEMPVLPRPVPGAIKAYEQDFRLALGNMEEYQQRIDRLTTVVTAIMSIADSRRALADNKNIGRLTWLATFFVPASLIAAMFSMQDLQQSSPFTWWVYFVVTIPVCTITIVIAVALSHDSVQKKLGLGRDLRDLLGDLGSDKR
jgi:hypothetical protein